MIRMAIAAIICASVTACAAPPVVQTFVPFHEPVIEQQTAPRNESRCPPLPLLPAAAPEPEIDPDP